MLPVTKKVLESQRLALALLALAVFIPPTAALAAGPNMVHYQGYLTDDGGIPVTTPVALMFKIYDTDNGGTPLWTEDQGNVTPINGVFNVMLGSVTALTPDLFAGGPRWLETVVDNTALTPRRQFLSVPYAMHAAVADSALTGGGGGDSVWQTSGNNVYRLLGNIGVGTSNPTSHLTISRDSQAQNHQLELRNVGSIQQPNYDGIVFTQGSSGQTTLGSIQLDYRNSGNPDMGFSLRGLSNVLYLKGATPADPQPWGRVGIGTTTPTSRLDVVSNTNPIISAQHSATSGADGAIAIRGSRSTATATDAAYVDLRNFDEDEGGGTDFAMGRIGAGMNDASGQTGYLRFSTNNGTGIAERMRIDKTGNVGVGTTTPAARLHVLRDAFSTETLVKIEDNNSNNNALTVNKTVGDGSAGSFAITNAASNPNASIYALTTGAGQAGLFQINNAGNTSPVIETLRNGGGLHARFNGNVQVTGNLTKGSGTFKIDHPLDPESKYLSHSFVESPDMMNIYNGNSVCNAQGEVVVKLPDWFESLNDDYRYQLTCIGGAAPVYVASELENNTFTIAGGAPGLKVSWQVTGIRRDAYAMANRVQVEEQKPEHLIGFYLHPEAFGLPAERSVAAAENRAEAGAEHAAADAAGDPAELAAR